MLHGYALYTFFSGYKLIQSFFKDQHDAIDFTDNAIVTLGNLPLLKRLHTLLLANNRIQSISPSIHLSVPNLHTLVLTNNNILELGDLEALKELKHLKYISLLGNPVQEKRWYREWLSWRIPNLRVLDFQRIRDKVRSSAPICISRDSTIPSLVTIPLGTYSGKSAIRDCGRSPNSFGYDNIDHCLCSFDSCDPDHGRTKGSHRSW